MCLQLQATLHAGAVSHRARDPEVQLAGLPTTDGTIPKGTDLPSRSSLTDGLSDAAGSVTGYQEGPGGAADAEESRLCILAVSTPSYLILFYPNEADQTATTGRKKDRSISSGRTIPQADQVAGR